MNKRIRGTGFFGRAVIVFVLIVLIISAFQVQMKINDLKTEKNELQDKLSVAEYNVEKLQNDYDRAIDDEYITEAAKERLKYREPGEIIFYNDLSD